LDFGSSGVFPIGVAMHTQATAHKALFLLLLCMYTAEKN